MSAKTLADSRQFQCGGCGRAIECTPYDLLVCRRTGWPTCCGVVMGVVVEDADGGSSEGPVAERYPPRGPRLLRWRAKRN